MSRKTFSQIDNSDELKAYLDKPFTYIRKSVFHYTTMDALLEIYSSGKFKTSHFERCNDIMECNFVTDEVKQLHFVSLMRSMVENFGMWAMYGQLNNKDLDKYSTEEGLKHICVKIEIPIGALKELIKVNGDKIIKASSVVYTDLHRKNTKHVYKIGSCSNSKGIELNAAVLSGYVKDMAWMNEQELRIWSKEDFIDIPDTILEKFQIIPNLFMKPEEARKLIESDERYTKRSNLFHFKESEYYGMYRA